MSNRYGEHGYTLVSDVDVREWPRSRAVVARDLYKRLAAEFGRPVVAKIGELHFELLPEHGVPGNTVVVPNGTANGGTRLLIQKQG